MFRVSTTPIISSTQNCNYNFRYRASTFLQGGQAWPRRREVAAQKLWPVPEAVVTVFCTPDDGCSWHPKHVEWTCRIINRLLCVASRWTIIDTISSVMSDRPSVRPHGTTRFPSKRIFMKFNILGLFEKSVEKVKVSFTSEKSNWHEDRYMYIHDHISPNSQNYHISVTKCRENQNTRASSVPKIAPFLIMKKNTVTAWYAIDDNMAHAHWKLDN